VGDVIVLIPLGVIGLIRWLSWLVRRIPAVLYRSYESDHVEPMSLVTPVYQEDPELFRQAIESWLANDVAEIICVIDQTDKASIEVARNYPVQIIVTDVPGKRDALRKGWEAATSPIVALVDSDTLWARDAREQILKPFEDPMIGGVGTRQNVYNPENVWQNINDMYLDYRYFDEIASQTRVSRAVSCLSGRTAAYRRELLLEVSDDFMGEKFLGVPCNSGEDKRLTSLILERGHQTYMQRNARVWSTFPPDPSTFFKQRLRWSRNTWRSDLRALKRRWIFRHKFLAFTTIDKAVASFTLMVAPAYMTWGLINLNWGLVSALTVWWIISRAAKHLPHLHRKPLHFFIIPIFVLVSFAVALVKIYALLTVRKQRWLTRQVEVIDGEIVRTGDDEPAPVTADRNDEQRVLVGASVAASQHGSGPGPQARAAVAGPALGPVRPDFPVKVNPWTAPGAPVEAAPSAAGPPPAPVEPEIPTGPVVEPPAPVEPVVGREVSADPPTEDRTLDPDPIPTEDRTWDPDPIPTKVDPPDQSTEPAAAEVEVEVPSEPQAETNVPARLEAPPPTGSPVRGLAPPTGSPVQGIAAPTSFAEAMAAVTRQLPRRTAESDDVAGEGEDPNSPYQNKEEMVDALLAELVDLPLRGRRKAQQRFDQEEGA